MSVAVQPVPSMRSSDLSRNPQAVFAAAENGPVEITRRDGESFLLCRIDHSRRVNEGVAVAAEVLSALLAAVPVESDPLERVFPWLRFFDPADRALFRREFVEATRACAAVGRYDHLLLTVNAWERTAQALADGLHAEPVDNGSHEDPVPVQDPRM